MQSDLVHTCLKSNVTSLIWLSHCPGESNAKVPRPQCEPPPSLSLLLFGICAVKINKNFDHWYVPGVWFMLVNWLSFPLTIGMQIRLLLLKRLGWLNEGAFHLLSLPVLRANFDVLQGDIGNILLPHWPQNTVLGVLRRDLLHIKNAGWFDAYLIWYN